MPNTLRERLLDLQQVRNMAGVAGDRSVIALCDWLRAGLLDQAGSEGGGEVAVNVQASGETATAGISHAGSVSASEQSRSSVELQSPTVPHPPSPAPESVEGVVSHNSVGGLWANRVTVPPSWRLGQRVRITRLDPEAT